MHDDIKTVLLTKEEIDARVQEMGKADVPAGYEKALVLYAADYFDLGYLNFACGKTAVLLKKEYFDGKLESVAWVPKIQRRLSELLCVPD